MFLLAGGKATGEPQGNEHRIWGPPGCGKTTYLTRQVGIAAEKYGPSRIMITSFTRAAAAELVGRQLPVPKQAIGTLHSHCYRALGHPDIAEGHIAEWNREHTGYRLSPVDLTVDEMSSEMPINRGIGDELMAQQQILRARRVPIELWPGRARAFYRRWCDWKTVNGLRDFTDLLEVAVVNFPTAPGHPYVIFVDEAQDLSPLQLALLRQWGQRSEHFVMAGDDDQTIYGFAGAAPEVLLDHIIPERFRHVLKQSYRVPRAVHRLSQKWIGRVAVREPKEYLPRDADGELRLYRRGNYKHPEPIVDDAENYVATGKSVMFLTTCSYMLEPLKAVLRKRGLPFHNPYRRKRTDWNPLHPPEPDGRHAAQRDRSLTAAERLIAFLRPHAMADAAPWRPGDVVAWTAWLKAKGVLAPGALDRIDCLLSNDVVGQDRLRELLTSSAYDRLTDAIQQAGLDEALAWWMESLKPPRRRAAHYPVRVIERGGIEAVHDTPKIIIGTGHSVKGGEGDVVYVFPDLSPSGTRNWEGKQAERDSVVRLGYVMMTRARETLVICEPAGTEFMPMGTVAASVIRQRGGLR